MPKTTYICGLLSTSNEVSKPFVYHMTITQSLASHNGMSIRKMSLTCNETKTKIIYKKKLKLEMFYIKKNCDIK